MKKTFLEHFGDTFQKQKVLHLVGVPFYRCPLLHRRTYQQKFMQVRKDKSNTKLAKDFETWKKQAKGKINDMKKSKLTENEVYEWIMNNK